MKLWLDRACCGGFSLNMQSGQLVCYKKRPSLCANDILKDICCRLPGSDSDLRRRFAQPAIGDQRIVPLTPTAVVPFNLFRAVTKPVESCLQKEVRVTASYLDSHDGLICSGVIENVPMQTSLTESVNLEIRPWNLQNSCAGRMNRRKRTAERNG